MFGQCGALTRHTRSERDPLFPEPHDGIERGIQVQVIVTCRAMQIESDTPERIEKYWRDHNLEASFPLSVGKDYLVQAVTVHLGLAWYYVHDDDDLEWPIWYPATLFTLRDGEIPVGWVMGYVHLGAENQYPVLSFPGWANDRFFYERLVDGEDQAVRIYAARRAFHPTDAP